MRTPLMTGIAFLAVSAVVGPAPVFAADEAAGEAATPPAPQGPFFSRGMADNMGFPPMGFDPMNPTGSPQGAPAVPPGPGMHNGMNNNAGAGLGGGSDVDIQIRGRIKLNGQGAGRQGLGANNFWQNGPYGMPYNHGYGAPYGTPFSQGYGVPQPTAPAPSAPQASSAEAPAPEQAPSPAPLPEAPVPDASAAEEAPAQPFSWAPKDGMSGPSGFYAQPQMPAAPQPNTQAQPQPAPQPQAQPTRPQEPEWVKKQRAEAAKRQKEAQERFAEMQKNNPYAQQQGVQQPGVQQPGQSVWSGPQNMNRRYGMPFQHGYGAPYGAPFMGQPYGYAQPQAPAESGGAEK